MKKYLFLSIVVLYFLYLFIYNTSSIQTSLAEYIEQFRSVPSVPKTIADKYTYIRASFVHSPITLMNILVFLSLSWILKKLISLTYINRCAVLHLQSTSHKISDNVLIVSKTIFNN